MWTGPGARDKQVVRVKKEKGEKGEKGKGKETKGKEMEGKETEGKETEGMETGMDGGWTLVNGEGRCAACRKERVSCRINLPAIEGWRRAIQQGKKLRPAGTTCRRCADKKVACELPATADLRIAQKRLRGAKRAASPIASVASSGKRQKTESEGQKGSTRGKKVEVVIPVRAGQGKAGVGSETTEKLLREMLTLMREQVELTRRMVGRMPERGGRRGDGPREESSGMAARRMAATEEGVIELVDSSEEMDEDADGETDEGVGP